MSPATAHTIFCSSSEFSHSRGTALARHLSNRMSPEWIVHGTILVPQKEKIVVLGLFQCFFRRVGKNDTDRDARVLGSRL